MARAGIQITNPGTGSVVIDERYKNVALLPTSAGAILTAVDAAGKTYAFGYPPTIAGGGAALVVRTADGSVAFDSRYKYMNVVDVQGGAVGMPGTDGTTVLYSKTYPAGRTYAYVVLAQGFASAKVAVSAGLYRWRFTDLLISFSGTTLTVSTTTYTESETFSGAAAAGPTFPVWRVAVVDVTGFASSGSTSGLSTPYLSISKTTAPVDETITLSWTAATRAPQTGQVTYTVHWTRASDGAQGNLDPTTALSITTGGSVATTYTYYVTASDSAGSSAASNTVQIVRTNAYVPVSNVKATPASLSGSATGANGTTVSSNATTISWTGGSGAYLAAVNYVSGTSGLLWHQTGSTANSVTGYFTATLNAGSYSSTYQAVVADSQTNGTANITIALTLTAQQQSVLPTPTVAVSPSTVTEPAAATISWNAVARTPAANGTVTYTLYYRQNGGAWNTINKGTATSHNTGSTSGLGGNSFDYQIVASDNGGSSGYSNLVTLTINKPATGVSNVRTTPTNFGVTDPNGTNVASKLLSVACTAVAWDGDQNATVKWTYLSGTQLSGIPTASNGTGNFSHTVARGQTVSATYRCNVYGTSSSGYSDHTVTLTLGPIS